MFIGATCTGRHTFKVAHNIFCVHINMFLVWVSLFTQLTDENRTNVCVQQSKECSDPFGYTRQKHWKRMSWVTKRMRKWEQTYQIAIRVNNCMFHLEILVLFCSSPVLLRLDAYADLAFLLSFNNIATRNQLRLSENHTLKIQFPNFYGSIGNRKSGNNQVILVDVFRCCFFFSKLVRIQLPLTLSTTNLCPHAFKAL